MILDKQTETLVMEEGEVQETFKTEIDIDSLQFLKRMLSKFYSDTIGSCVREVTSNAWDSHKEANTDVPIVVAFKKNKDGNYEFSVEDKGIGINKDTINQILRKYGKSTKRLSANQLGAYGLGWKSPIAYTPSFHFIGRKDGVEIKAMMYESEDDIEIDVLYEGPTTEANGVKVVVPVKWADREDFRSKISEQLAYFENVYFDVEYMSNDFTITRSEHYQHSSLYGGNYMHVSLGDIYYPLDFSKLGIPAIAFPIALRFGLSDGIIPVPNREQLKYSAESKKIILDKIAIVADIFMEKYNATIKDSDNLKAIFDYYNTSSRSIAGFNGGYWDVTCLQKYSKIQFLSPKMKGVDKLNLQRLYHMKDYIVQEWNKGYESKGNGRLYTLKNKWSNTMYFSDLSRGSVFYTYSEVPNKQKKDYIREQLGGKQAYFLEKYRSYTLKGKELNSNLSTYKSILQLNLYPKTEWRQIIKEFKYIQELMFKNMINIDSLIVPQQWIDAKKKQKVQLMIQKGTNVRRKKLVGEVTGRVARQLERYVSGKNCKFENEVIQLKEVEKSKYITIYCENTEENENNIQRWFTVVKKDKIKFVTFSSRELAKLKELDVHNWVKMEDFLKGDNKSFKRIATAYLINNLIEQYNSVFKGSAVITNVSTDLAGKMKSLSIYRDEWYVRGDNKLYQAILEVAESKDLFDKNMHHTYKSVKFTLEKLKFLKPIFDNIAAYNMKEEVIQAIRDLFKYHKTRIDWQHYGIKINEEVKPLVEVEEITI